MDDAAPNLVQSQAQASQSQTTLPQPEAPISVPQKEAEPTYADTMGKSPITQNIEVPNSLPNQTEYIKPSGAETSPIIPPEVAEHGVEAVLDHEKPKITPEHKQVGIEPAKEAVPVVTQPQGTVQLPMSEEDALNTIKTTSASESKHWLAVLVEKAYKHLRRIV